MRRHLHQRIHAAGLWRSSLPLVCVHSFRRAAGDGNALGMVGLAEMYADGRGGLPKDDVQVVGWLRKAADAGHARGMAALGMLYATGRRGLPNEDIQAVNWLRRAADAGEPLGMAGLAEMYADGRGVLPKDDVQSVNWVARRPTPVMRVTPVHSHLISCCGDLKRPAQVIPTPKSLILNLASYSRFCFFLWRLVVP
jgi:hypothetical protein